MTMDNSFINILRIKCLVKVLKKVKLPLSKATIEKLSAADTNTVCQFLKSLKLLVDELEREKKLKLEQNQNYPIYIIANDDMIQVQGIHLFCVTLFIFISHWYIAQCFMNINI